MMKHFIPEITSMDAENGVSDVDPYYSDEFSNEFDMNDYGPEGLDHE